jgi:hypothetical protein
VPNSLHYVSMGLSPLVNITWSLSGVLLGPPRMFSLMLYLHIYVGRGLLPLVNITWSLLCSSTYVFPYVLFHIFVTHIYVFPHLLLLICFFVLLSLYLCCKCHFPIKHITLQFHSDFEQVLKQTKAGIGAAILILSRQGKM